MEKRVATWKQRDYVRDIMEATNKPGADRKRERRIALDHAESQLSVYLAGVRATERLDQLLALVASPNTENTPCR